MSPHDVYTCMLTVIITAVLLIVLMVLIYRYCPVQWVKVIALLILGFILIWYLLDVFGILAAIDRPVPRVR